MSTVDEGDVADPSVDVLIRVHQLVAASDNDREESSREAAAKASSLEDEVDRQRLLEEAKQTGKSRLRRLEVSKFMRPRFFCLHLCSPPGRTLCLPGPEAGPRSRDLG